MDQRRQVAKVDGMDARQDLAELARDHRPRLLVGRIAQELARDRRAVDALHDEAFAQPILRGELEQHLRRPHAAFVGGGQHAKLGGAVQCRARAGAGLASTGPPTGPVVGGSRRRIRPWRWPSTTASKLQVWREAPPDSRLSRSIAAGLAKCRPAAPARAAAT